MLSPGTRRLLILIIGIGMVILAAIVALGFAEIVRKNDGSLACVYLALFIVPVWLLLFWKRGLMVSRMARGSRNVTLSGYRRGGRRND